MELQASARSFEAENSVSISIGSLFSEIPKRKDLESLLGEAESADSEWLNSVFDTSMRDMLGSGVVNDAVSAAEQDEDDSLSDINSDEEGRAETAELLRGLWRTK